MLSSIPPLRNMYHLMLSHYLQIFIIKLIYVHKTLTAIFSKLIASRLLIKRTTECTFEFNSRFFIQVGGCTMAGPLSITFSDIYLVKMEMLL